MRVERTNGGKRSSGIGHNKGNPTQNETSGKEAKGSGGNQEEPAEGKAEQKQAKVKQDRDGHV